MPGTGRKRGRNERFFLRYVLCGKRDCRCILAVERDGGDLRVMLGDGGFPVAMAIAED